MDERLSKIESEIALIKERNSRVEANKAWETSVFRTISIVVITYILVAIVMYVIGVTKIFMNALIPTLGFFLSVQSLPILRRWWINKYLNK